MKAVKTTSKGKEVKVKNEAKTVSDNVKQEKKNVSESKKISAKLQKTEKNLCSVWHKIHFSAVYVVLAALAIWFSVQNHRLAVQNEQIKNNLSQKINVLKNQVAKQVVNERRVYICNMEEIYAALQVEERNRNFEIELDKLNNEVKSAQKKIDSLKNAKVKANYSDVYLNSLVAKRDKVAEDYQNSLQQTLANVNQALSEVAAESGVNVIFRSKATAVSTKYTVDVTQKVLEKIKNMENKK